MQSIIAIGILTAVGCVTGLLCHRISSNFWRATFIAGIVATSVWVSGIYILFWLTAPSELGPPAPAPIFLTFCITFALAAFMGRLRHDPRATDVISGT